MPARPRELLAVLTLIVVADVAFYGAAPEISAWGAAGALVVIPLVVLLAARARRWEARAFVTMAALAALAMRCAYAPSLFALTMGALGVGALAIVTRIPGAAVADVLVSLATTALTAPRRILAAHAGLRAVLGGHRARAGERVAQVVVPLGVLALFVGIFGLANPLVARGIAATLRALTLPAPSRALLWMGALVCAILLVRPAWRGLSRGSAAVATEGAADGHVTLARNVLLVTNAAFLVENVLDATYLWAGSPPPGMSERAYAHQGAAWLTVAMALMTVVVGVLFRGPLAHDPKARSVRAIALVWLGQGIVLALGAHRRLFIHVQTSGVSSARLLGAFGTTLVAASVVLIGIKLFRRRSFVWLVRQMGDTIALGLVAFVLLPSHQLSAAWNLRRVMAHEYQPLVHVEEEVREAESAPLFLPMLNHDDERIRRGIAALLLDERDALRKARASLRPSDVSLADTRALRALDAATPALDAVLGDVEREDAIRPFEYIRNSAIEGEIAQSEISKVVPAETRSETAVREWLEQNTTMDLFHRYGASTTTFTPTGDPNRLDVEVTFPANAARGAQEGHVKLSLNRVRPGHRWYVEER